MRRRHLLALTILALVVGTVLAMGPMRTWDALTLRTVETYWPSGRLRYRYRIRYWETSFHAHENYDRWYENGQKDTEARHHRIRAWYETGELRSYGVAGTGVLTLLSEGKVYQQLRYKDHEIVESRTSPPWFTEEEILQSVEGGEE